MPAAQPVTPATGAILRHDLDVDEITVAALLTEVTDILCWSFAPALTYQVYEMQRIDRNLRSVVAQKAAFNFSARELQTTLVRHWHLHRTCWYR